MNDNYIAMLYGAIRILEDISHDYDVTLDDVNQAIADLYAVINENAPSSSSANSVGKIDEADPMIFKFSDYIKTGGNNGDFPRRAS